MMGLKIKILCQNATKVVEAARHLTLAEQREVQASLMSVQAISNGGTM
jgi:hypothetical protein